MSQLSHLVRGVRPREMQIEGGLNERPPMIRVVLSLREDYLGLLDDAADYLPQILDHRFRLSALTLDAAAEAMIGPAKIEDACLATRPFQYDAEAVGVVMTYLSHRRVKSVAQMGQHVEPFQLQLVCQRVEQIVTERQWVEEGELIITTKDIGGETAIRETLKNFYTRSIGVLSGQRTRRATRRLCQEFLISPEGRRLSLEEHEICRQLPLTPEILQQLVKERLLRSEYRSTSTYYELSHDALIDPVIATKRWQGLVFGWLGLGATSIALAYFITIIIDYTQTITLNMSESIGNILFSIFFILVLIRPFNKSLASLRRLRPRTPGERASVLDAGYDRMKFIHGVGGVVIGILSVLLSLMDAVIATLVTDVVVNGLRGNLVNINDVPPEDVTDELRWIANLEQSVSQYGIGLDLIAYFVSIPVVALGGFVVVRWGIRKLLGARRYTAPVERPRGLLLRLRGSSCLYIPRVTFSILGLVGGACVLLAAFLAAGMESLLIVCSQFKGQFSEQIPAEWFNTLAFQCREALTKGYWNDSKFYEWIYLIIFVASSVGIFTRGLRGVYLVFRARQSR